MDKINKEERNLKYNLGIGMPTNGYQKLGHSENTHKYIVFEKRIKKSVVDDIVTVLTQYYLKTNKGRKILANDSKATIIWGDKNEKKSHFISFKIFERFILEKGLFDPNALNLPPYQCDWLDAGIEVTMDWHSFDHTAPTGMGIIDGTVKRQFGPGFPIRPTINREGRIISNMQPFLISKIIQNRLELIENSHLALSHEWFYMLKSLIIDIISLVDITLNQTYTKAEYNINPNWKFKKDILGERVSRRLNDKLKWVYQITGNHPNIEQYRNSLNNLREIRNHLNHFDPPTIAYEIDEVTDWLNQVIDVANIVYKIREALNAEISTKLINLLLQKRVSFIPRLGFEKRLPRTEEHGYKTSIWKGGTEQNIKYKGDILKKDGITYKLDEWLTINMYCEKFGIANTQTINNWISRGIIPSENVVDFKDMNDLRLIKAIKYYD